MVIFIHRAVRNTNSAPQQIILIDVDNNNAYSMQVKRTYSSAKESKFCFYIPYGRYALYQYEWGTEDSLYYEQIMKRLPDVRYSFLVEKSSVNYLGTWHFDTRKAFFTNDKEKQDEFYKKRQEFLFIDF